MTDLHGYLLARLNDLEYRANRGVIPGEQDTLELIHLMGRIEELKRVIEVIEEQLA